MNKETVIANTVEYETIPISIPEYYMEQFDFVDLGAKNGNMEKYAQETFGAQRGLHFEINDVCVKTMEERGISCVQADITNMILPENCVDFVISTHTIEHLMDLDAVKRMIEISVNAVTDFVYLTWPWFDSDDYLKDLGLIPFPSTWDIHTCHVTISDLKNILKELSLEGLFMAWPRIFSSEDDWILPIDYPKDMGGFHNYKPEYGIKPIVNFTQPVYHESVCFIVLRDSQKTKDSIKYIRQYNWDII
jgi:hypothetical protein